MRRKTWESGSGDGPFGPPGGTLGGLGGPSGAGTGGRTDEGRGPGGGRAGRTTRGAARVVRGSAGCLGGTPVVALAYLLVIPAKSSQMVYRLNMKESLRARMPQGRNTPARARPASTWAGPYRRHGPAARN